MTTSKRPYQSNNYIKDSRKKDPYKQRKDMILEKDISDHNREQWLLWVTFFRRNIHRFIIDVMGIKLFPFQILWIYAMQISPLFVAICSRTASKSFLVAVFTTARSILYPGLTTIIAATTKEQSGRIIKDKVQYLYNNSDVCKNEIEKLVTNKDNYECIFRNGSIITVVAANGGALGSRCNDLIVDEFAQMDKQILDEILKPFLFPRQTPFHLLKEYDDYTEPIRLYYISSAWYQSEWWYKTTLSIAKSMAEGKKVGFFATDYLSSLKHNLKQKEQIEEEKINNAAFDMQYGNIPGDANNDSYFQIGMFIRKIQKAFYPMRSKDYTLKKNPFAISRMDGEIRIMGVDVSSRVATSNDNSVISCIRLFPSKKGYERHLVYMESSHGENHTIQANRIKDIWYDFQAEYIAMDMQNVGISVYEDLGMPYFNEERGIQMPSFTVMDSSEIDDKVRKELKDKTLGANPIPNIFPISGTANLNTEIHVEFRDSLQKKLWQFLVDDNLAEDFLIKSGNEEFKKNDSNSRAFYLHPYVQVNLFVSEAINLKTIVVNANIKLVEGSSKRKDRYSSVSYANHLCCIFDKDILREEDDEDGHEMLDMLQF